MLPFADDLKRFGPQAASQPPLSLAQARHYCRTLCRQHYENFSVASLLLPRTLRQHIANIYAYCRWADDLADEIHDPQQSLDLLDWWQSELDHCYRGQKACHPVFVALRETIEQYEIPQKPFADLLVAFRQDQRITRYKDLEELLNYCGYSANPVGRLVLYLGRCHTDDRAALSDSICTGLQLANFWQDVARDWDIGRVYLPQDACRQFGFSESDFARRQSTDSFRQLLAAQVEIAEKFLRRGLPLAQNMSPGLQRPVALFAAGGLATLKAIRRQGYDVWTRRPTVSKLKKFQLLVRYGWRLP